MSNPELTFYTDGGCDNNGHKRGAFAWFCQDTGEMCVEYHQQTTSNIMEMSAVIGALRSTPGGAAVGIYSDSEYVIKGITSWIKGWKKKNWRTAGGDPVKNKQLWETLDELCSKRQVAFYKVKAHSGIFGNELVDHLASAAQFKQGDLSAEEMKEVFDRVAKD